MGTKEKYLLKNIGRGGRLEVYAEYQRANNIIYLTNIHFMTLD